jgi:CRP-like cAMP-binding protein
LANPPREIDKDALRGSPLFAAMTRTELETVVGMASRRRFRRGQSIFQKGDPGGALLAVLSGRVRIASVSTEGKEVTLNVINRGEVFGEIALLDGKPRSADAIAIEDTVTLALERRDFLPFVLGNPDLAGRLLAILCERLRRTSMALEDLALFDLPARLARVLLQLAADYGRPCAQGVRIDLKLSQRDLSGLIASTRESVNKQLRLWRAQGLVRVDGAYLIVADPVRLRAVVDGEA